MNGRDFWVFNDTAVSQKINPPVGQSYLDMNGTLNEGSSLNSPNGYYRAVLQTDGNFVIYQAAYGQWWARWSDGMNNAYGTNHIVLQSDGNLVDYLWNNAPIWSTGTSGEGGIYLAMQSDGNLVLYNPNNQPLWSSNSGHINAPSWPTISPSGWYMTGFISGSTAGVQDTPVNAAPQSLSELNSWTGDPVSFLPNPTNVYMPDGSGRSCTAANGANYQTRWPNGATMIDGRTMLVTYGEVCVAGLWNLIAEGWGYGLYDIFTNRWTTINDVFAPNRNGSTFNHSTIGTPVMSNGNIVMFDSHCNNPYLGCGIDSANTVSTITLSPGNLGNPNAYNEVPLANPIGAWSWQPQSVSVTPDLVHGGFTMIEQSSIGGAYEIYKANNPTGPWTFISHGIMPGCDNAAKGFCYSFQNHPEISSVASRAYVSYWNPNASFLGGMVLSNLPSK